MSYVSFSIFCLVICTHEQNVCAQVAQKLHKVHCGCTVSHSSQQLVPPPDKPPGGCNGALGGGDHNHHDAEQISFLYPVSETLTLLSIICIKIMKC